MCSRTMEDGLFIISDFHGIVIYFKCIDRKSKAEIRLVSFNAASLCTSAVSTDIYTTQLQQVAMQTR
jgi:hypothetical protein